MRLILWTLLALHIALAASAQPISVPATTGIDPTILQILNERDRQYAQRFDAQEKGTALALTAQEKGTALALTAIKEFTTAAFVAAKEAVDKAQLASEKRFDSVNEFRNTLKDQQARFIDKSEVEIRVKALNDKIDLLASRADSLTARVDQSSGNYQGIVWIIGVLLLGAGVLIGGIGLFRRNAAVPR